MLTVTPNYYNKFSCIADKCKHNCCIGWEIDIDKNTYLKYKSLTGILQEKFMNCISANNDGGTFVLTEKESCPFLNDAGLCEIIINYGYDYLSEICREHPRFINVFSDRIEKGIGLCCEAAADLIVKCKDTVTFISDGDTFDNYEKINFFNIRQVIFEIIQDRTVSINDRINEITEMFKLNVNIDKLNLINFMKSLEILDNKWKDMLELYIENMTHQSISSIVNDYEVAYEQLFVYFIYRHLSESVFDGRFRERLMFCIFSCEIIFNLCENKLFLNGDIDIDDFVDISRMYSSEIEYSEENTESLINYFSSFN